MAAVFTLGKSERLKSRKQLEALFASGRSFPHSPYRVYYQYADRAPGAATLQLGVGVSSRHFKKAVDRNRLKRLMRESWRLQKQELAESLRDQNRQLQVFLIYTGKEMASFDLLQKITKAVIHKLMHVPEGKRS